MPVDATADRLRAHLRAVSDRYPHAWGAIAGLRRDRQALGDWPRWCYCPLAGAYAVVSGGSDAPIPLERGIDVAVVGALAAWRATQGIYRVDPDLLAALWATPVTGDLPEDILYRLPEWCVYVETPGLAGLDGPLAGFWAHLEYDVATRRTELRLLLDRLTDGQLQLEPLILHLGHGSLSAAIAAAMDETERQAREHHGWTPEIRQATETLRHRGSTWTAPLVSVLLYLCSEAAEIRDGRGTDRRPRRPAPVTTKRGPKEVPASAPTTWEVGWRIGAALRLAREQEETGYSAGTHTGPRAHLRRAHWHSYWTGHRTETQRGDRLVLRWVHPILVGAGEVVPTIHGVD